MLVMENHLNFLSSVASALELMLKTKRTRIRYIDFLPSLPLLLFTVTPNIQSPHSLLRILQICWLWQKVNSEEDRRFQRFLDNVQYKCSGILRYERVFGEGYVSTGGVGKPLRFLASLVLISENPTPCSVLEYLLIIFVGLKVIAKEFSQFHFFVYFSSPVCLQILFFNLNLIIPLKII